MTLITDDLKTEWYPQESKPVHIGAYEISYPREHPAHGKVAFFGMPAIWNGKEWCYPEWDNSPLVVQNRPWRGLKAPHDGQTS